MTSNSINTSRRWFLKAGGASVAWTLGEALLGKAGRVLAAPSNKVYVAYHNDFVDSNNQVNHQMVQAGIDCLVKAMAGQSSVGAAWETLVPGTVTTTTKISMKMNVMMTFNAPHLATLQGVVNGMKQMLGGTYPAGNISAYDNDFSRLENASLMHRTYPPAELDKLGIWYPDTRYIGAIKYGPTQYTIYNTKFMIPTKLEGASLGISFVNVRPHKYFAGYLSGVIKNMMGAISLDTDSYLRGKTNNPSPYHGGFHNKTNFQGYVDMYKNCMNNHIQLHIADMLFIAPNETLPQERVEKRLVMGADPCAVDAYVVDVLREYYSQVRKDVPQALANAGVGTTSYQLVNVPVVAGPVPVTTIDVQQAIKDHKAGKKTVFEVQAIIDKYMKRESL